MYIYVDSAADVGLHAKDVGKQNTLLPAAAAAGTHIDVSRLSHGSAAGQGEFLSLRAAAKASSSGPPWAAAPQQCAQAISNTAII
jgi:hypothetical protein